MRIQGPEKCFPGFLMTFSWDFHNIVVHSVPLFWVSESFRQDIGQISAWKVLFLLKYIYL